MAVSISAPALADNSKCWSNGTDDKTRPDITCLPLTEELLLSLHHSTRAEVVKAMNATGRNVTIGLHYLSNAKTYSGDVNFHFDDDRVDVINVIVSPSEKGNNLEFIWNENLPGCSDFPGSNTRCHN